MSNPIYARDVETGLMRELDAVETYAGSGIWALRTTDSGGAIPAAAGTVTETGTTAVTGSFKAITVLEAATFSVFTETGATGDAMTGFAIPAGVTLFGNITAFTLTSGKVRAYNS